MQKKFRFSFTKGHFTLSHLLNTGIDVLNGNVSSTQIQPNFRFSLPLYTPRPSIQLATLSSSLAWNQWSKKTYYVTPSSVLPPYSENFTIRPPNQSNIHHRPFEQTLKPTNTQADSQLNIMNPEYLSHFDRLNFAKIYFEIQSLRAEIKKFQKQLHFIQDSVYDLKTKVQNSHK